MGFPDITSLAVALVVAFECGLTITDSSTIYNANVIGPGESIETKTLPRRQIDPICILYASTICLAYVVAPCITRLTVADIWLIICCRQAVWDHTTVNIACLSTGHPIVVGLTLTNCWIGDRLPRGKGNH